MSGNASDDICRRADKGSDLELREYVTPAGIKLRAYTPLEQLLRRIAILEDMRASSNDALADLIDEKLQNVHARALRMEEAMYSQAIVKLHGALWEVRQLVLLLDRMKVHLQALRYSEPQKERERVRRLEIISKDIDSRLRQYRTLKARQSKDKEDAKWLTEYQVSPSPAPTVPTTERPSSGNWRDRCGHHYRQPSARR
jgi:hypothetical protein